MKYILYAFGSLYGLWLFYLAVMNLMKARDAGRLTKPAKVLGMPFLWFGLILDFLVNQIVMTVVLLEIPRELLVTTRVTRHKYEGTGWRKRVAEAMCKHLLDPFDPTGCHCKK